MMQQKLAHLHSTASTVDMLSGDMGWERTCDL